MENNWLVLRSDEELVVELGEDAAMSQILAQLDMLEFKYAGLVHAARQPQVSRSQLEQLEWLEFRHAKLARRKAPQRVLRFEEWHQTVQTAGAEMDVLATMTHFMDWKHNQQLLQEQPPGGPQVHRGNDSAAEKPQPIIEEPLDDPGAPVARLNEVLQRLGLNAKDAFVPDWQEDGPGHKRRYRAQVTLDLRRDHDIEPLFAISPWMNSKRDTKATLATALLGQLPEHIVRPTRRKGSLATNAALFPAPAQPALGPGLARPSSDDARAEEGAVAAGRLEPFGAVLGGGAQGLPGGAQGQPWGAQGQPFNTTQPPLAGTEESIALDEVKEWLVNSAPQVRAVLSLSAGSLHGGDSAAHKRLDMLLAEAFLHRSFVSRGSYSELLLKQLLGCPVPHNERLAWLGDAVLQQEASRAVFRRYPQADSNSLSLTRQKLVSNEACAAVIRAKGLWKKLLVRIPGADKLPEKVVSELWEAILGAVRESAWPSEVSRLIDEQFDAFAEVMTEKHPAAPQHGFESVPFGIPENR